MRSTAHTRDITSEQTSTSGRSLSYTAYEGNSWQTTFDQSGTAMKDLVRSGHPRRSCLQAVSMLEY